MEPGIVYYLFVILWLVVLEGLLSADNALVLAVMVKRLPDKQRQKALLYGIWGAIGFRIIAVAVAGYLMKFWHFEVLGGGYLLFVFLKHFLSKPQQQNSDNVPVSARNFWTTVALVELTDIAFSIDSILAAVAFASDENIKQDHRFYIVIIGGVLGIVTMRFVANTFVKVLEKFPALESSAFLLVGWIGLKLVYIGLEHADHILKIGVGLPKYPSWLFWSVMVIILAGGILISIKKKKLSSEHKDKAI